VVVKFHQSGCCCDDSQPTGGPAGEFQTGPPDVHLGGLDVDGDPVEVWMSRNQFDDGRRRHLTIESSRGTALACRWRRRPGGTSSSGRARPPTTRPPSGRAAAWSALSGPDVRRNLAKIASCGRGHQRQWWP